MLVCTAMRSKTSPIRCGGDVSLPPTFQALTAIRLRAISSIGDIMLDSVHQGRSGMTIKRVDRFGQHQLFVVCVRYARIGPGCCGSRRAVVDGQAGRRRWSSLPRRCPRRVARPVGRRSAAPGRLPHRVPLPKLCGRARSRPRPCVAPRSPRFQRNPGRADQESVRGNPSGAPACTRSMCQRWMRRCRRAR